MNLTPELREQIKNYIQYCKDHKEELLNNDFDISNKNPFNLPPIIKEKIDSKFGGVQLEASTSSSVGGYMTPFAFVRKGPGNVKAAEMFGYKLVKPTKKSKKNESIVNVIDPVPVFKDKHGLVQHRDPKEDPALDGLEQSSYNQTMYEDRIEKIVDGLLDEIMPHKKTLNEDLPIQPKQQPQPVQKKEPEINVKPYDIHRDFTDFDTRLSKSTEAAKNEFQKKIQEKILGKKVVLYGSKGYKQPESEYTVNVLKVQIDYYYDKYFVIVVGRESEKQKVHKFFVNVKFKIKILGPADKKGTDNYEIAKSKTLVNNQPAQNINNKPVDTNITAQI